MDFHINSHPEPGKLEQIVTKFLLKILHIILDSRIPSLHRHDRTRDLSIPSVKKSDRWFNLVLGDRPAALDNLNFWHRNLMDPMVIDIILVHQNPNSSSMSDLHTTETVIERWVVQYESPRAMSPQHHTSETSTSYKKTYKKTIILLRSLYSYMRFLPAFRIFRQLSLSTQNCNFDLIYKVSSFSNPFSRKEEEIMKEYNFAPVEAFPGRLCVSVTYRPTLSDFNLESSVTLPAMIITDYVPSPSHDPSRSFSETGVCATSFPSRGIRPPFSSPIERPHSWTSGFHKAAAFTKNPMHGGSPQGYQPLAVPYDFSSPSPDNYDQRVRNYRSSIHRRVSHSDDYQLSPPFSPSASPSTPTYLTSGNPALTRMHSETAPVTIPLPIIGKNSRHLSPNFSDPNRNSLPPLSPRSWKHDPSPHESSSGHRSYRRAETLRAADLHSGAMNHYSGQKVSRDSRDDSGRFSGLLSSSGSPRVGFSRSSSRLSLQDDLDDCDFSCPFDVDDVETSDSPASQSHGRSRASESPSQSPAIGRKSQDAAVGALVHMLRAAPPLRQDSSCYSSQTLTSETETGVDTTCSGLFMPRRTTDALEELRSYRDMKDLLLSKSGTRLVSRDEAT